MYKIEVIGTYSFELPFKDSYGVMRSVRIDANEGFILTSNFDEFKDSILQEAKKYQAAGILTITKLSDKNTQKKEPEIPFKGARVTEKKSTSTKPKQTNNTTHKKQEQPVAKKPIKQEAKNTQTEGEK